MTGPLLDGIQRRRSATPFEAVTATLGGPRPTLTDRDRRFAHLALPRNKRDQAGTLESAVRIVCGLRATPAAATIKRQTLIKTDHNNPSSGLHTPFPPRFKTCV